MQLKIENASFSYKTNIPVISNLNFEAQSGDLIAVLGPNGAGKTTMLKCIMGFLKFNTGRSFFDGKDIRKIPQKKFWSKVSYVPQAKGISSSLNAEEMILLGLTSKIGVFSSPKQEDRKKVYEISERLKITHLLYKKCNEMSGGELQMVLIARALISEPELIILDEPESNLDFKNQIIVLDTLSSLASSGICVIFNTHYPEHALSRANKSLLLYKGGKSVFGETLFVITEKSIREAFGVDSVISDIETSGNVYKSIMPIGLSLNRQNEETEKASGNVIAVLSVIFSDYSLGTKINEIFSKYGAYVIGRMGMPYKDAKVYIINMTLDAPTKEIETLQHEISILPGVNVKATISERHS